MNKYIEECFAALAVTTIFMVGPVAFALYAAISGEYPATSSTLFIFGGLMSLMGVMIITLIPGCTLKLGQDNVDDLGLMEKETKPNE